MPKATSPNWLRLSQDEDSLLYEKEILPVGKFVKVDDDLEFEITEDGAHKIAASSNEMIKSGNKSPNVLTHSGQEPYGQFEEYYVKPNADGVPSIHGRVRFESKELRDKALTNDVSAYIPPEFIDGKGRRFLHPIRHTALTPYPVIPGLNRWQAVAASHNMFATEAETLELATEAEEELAVEPLDQIMEALSLEITEDMGDQMKLDAILAEIATLTGGEEDLGDEMNPPEVAASHGKGKGKKRAPALTLSADSPAVITVTNSRDKVLNALVLSEVIDPATRDALADRYCDSDAIALSMTENTDDGFDFVVEMLEKNEPVPRHLREEVPKKGVRLSHNRSNSNPLQADAEKRAKARAESRR